MDTGWIRGVIPPIVTPVDAEECVEEQGLRRVVEHVIAGGVHGILSMGSNGEFYGLDHEQQERAVRITLDQVGGRVPVYMGIGAIATKECVKLARMGNNLGVQAITILPPMFLTPNEDELYRHFRTIADATPLPVLLYNNPDRVGNNITVRLMERLADIPNIVGVKDSSGDMTLTAEYIRRTREKGFKVMAGRDVMILGSLAYGAVGCVASTANIVPALVVDIYNKFMSGDLSAACEAQFKLAPLRMAFNLASFPVVTKEAMNLIGLEVGSSILPNTAATEENRKKLRAILTEMGAI
ncbi:4-hydroxy-tetrahydrodipicolinate synthase [Paenibacillus whitsoniae]|uniref:4-hydroxy-tetrahydrodipicolinate synthase n=1 Tax=Paenibacillus whitsoniae TaxID=2496558 RepID=A0A3S0CW90_9BACL|nr:4-hydroxy-tetrahydrodipicolinate synthase [Paenibacillus whitsoniae]RTE10198.1 4-hydroxy-tetrahydrodipicolinate synthase [Paenibacillus whitsoniae]